MCRSLPVLLLSVRKRSEASILRFANGDVAFELLCVPNNKHYGKHEDFYFNGTMLKLLTDDQMCDSDAARSFYENVAVYKTRGVDALRRRFRFYRFCFVAICSIHARQSCFLH